MEREALIKKWLANSLNTEEQLAFNNLEDYAELTKLSSAMKRITPPEFDVDAQLSSLHNTIKSEQKTRINWRKTLLPIAAILVLCFGIFKFSNNQIKEINTIAAQKENLSLPDGSLVQLNTNSYVGFSENNWDDNRIISLKGEAFFNVSKGEKFVVATTLGNVTVLGTEFNVNDREGLFEVICFEGSVQVDYNDTTHILKPGETFSSANNAITFDIAIIDTTPTWINGTSSFKSKKYRHVISEFERQYNIKINTSNVDTNQVFTGSFPHDDLEKALQAVTMPLRIVVTRTNLKNIVLSSE